MQTWFSVEYELNKSAHHVPGIFIVHSVSEGFNIMSATRAMFMANIVHSN